MRSPSPSRFSPATASRVAPTSPRSTFASRVSTLPRSSVSSRSGRSRLTIAWRRSEAEPKLAPRGSRAMLVAWPLMKASRTSSRGR